MTQKNPVASGTQVSRRVVAQGQGFRATVMTLPPGAMVPWHTHSQALDHFFVMEGNVAILLAEPEERLFLSAGDECLIEPGRAHATACQGQSPCRVLLLQHGEKLDFIPADPASP